jgi:DNA-binding transcriptional LysR family regulator
VLRSLLLFDGAVSNLLSSFKRANPHVATKVVDDECEHLTGLLAGQEIDTILTMIRGDESEFANRALYKMPYMLAVRVDHRESTRRKSQRSCRRAFYFADTRREFTGSDEGTCFPGY